MQSELIISSYNAPDTLLLTLLTVLAQDRRPDSIAIADDGSSPETRQMLDAFQSAHTDLPLRHIWHEDQGFRKTVILNQSISSSDADYLIFTDGDCLLSPEFVARHLQLADPKRFCCGSMIRLSTQTTSSVTADTVKSGDVFSKAWLRNTQTTKGLSSWLKSGAISQGLGNALELLSPVRRTFCGANASVFRDALLQVNGYNENMVWGGEDKELGVRLANSGVSGRHLRYTAPVLHLHHTKGYADPEIARAQRAIIMSSRRSGKVWTENGIRPA